MRHLIVNADDFGYSFGINKGIIKAHTEGVVTSTSVMVDAIAAEEASHLVDYPDLSVGLHFVVQGAEDVKGELSRQLESFEKIVGRKPDHIDTHKMLPTDDKYIVEILRDYAKANKTPVRSLGYAKFIESFFGFGVDGAGELNEENVSLEALKRAISEATDEFNELMCHVGYSDDYLREHSSYNDIREKELETVTHPVIREYITRRQDLRLCNWKFVAAQIV